MATLLLLVPSAGAGAPKEVEYLPSPFPLAVEWSLELSGAPSTSPAHDGTQLYVPMRSGKLTAVALADGCVRWSVKLVSDRPPTAGDDAVYVSTAAAVHALRPEDGSSLWRFELAGVLAAAPVWSTGWLILGLEDGDLIALRAEDGTEIWRRSLGAPLGAPPSPEGPRLYAPLQDGRVVALDLLGGETIWERALPSAATDILALQDGVFVGSTDNFFYSLSSKDGAMRWRWRTGADVIGAPIVDESRVYFLSLDNVLRGLDRHVGNQRWKQSLLLRPASGPLLFGEIVLVSGRDHELEGYYTKDGTPLGTFAAPAELASPPLIYEDASGEQVVLIITGEGELQLLRPGTDPPLVALTYEPGIPSPQPLEPLVVLPGTALAPVPPPLTGAPGTDAAPPSALLTPSGPR